MCYYKTTFTLWHLYILTTSLCNAQDLFMTFWSFYSTNITFVLLLLDTLHTSKNRAIHFWANRKVKTFAKKIQKCKTRCEFLKSTLILISSILFWKFFITSKWSNDLILILHLHLPNFWFSSLSFVSFVILALTASLHPS